MQIFEIAYQTYEQYARKPLYVIEEIHVQWFIKYGSNSLQIDARICNFIPNVDCMRISGVRDFNHAIMHRTKTSIYRRHYPLASHNSNCK